MEEGSIWIDPRQKNKRSCTTKLAEMSVVTPTEQGESFQRIGKSTVDVDEGLVKATIKSTLLQDMTVTESGTR